MTQPAEVTSSPAPTSSAQTRLRLLEAAAQVFCDNGFRRTTVRAICDLADANVAAVKYHFGDKQQLYAATLKHWMDLSLENYPAMMGVSPDAPVEERLHGFVRGLLYRLLARGAPAWHGKLMAREMIEPTEAMDDLVADTVRPMSRMLQALVRELVGPGTSEEAVRACSLSVVGQCCFYRHAQEMLTRLYPDQAYEADDLDRLAEHVTLFTLAGLQAYRSEREHPDAWPSTLTPASTP